MPDEIPDIDDIIMPDDIPVPADPTMWIVIGVSLLILLIIVIFLLCRSPKVRAFYTDYNARKSALDKLHHLKENADSIQPATCGLAVTEALKEYLFNFHDPSSPYSTTGEIIHTLREKGTEDSTLAKITELLTSADALKYARSDSDVNARQPLIESAIQFIRDDQSPAPNIDENAPAFPDVR